MAVDGGGGAAVSHAPHVLRCGELISVHAEQDHGSVCLGGGLGAFLIVIGGTHSTGVLACPGAGVALPAKAGAGVPPPCKVDAEADGEKAVEVSQLSVGGAPATAPSARGT